MQLRVPRTFAAGERLDHARLGAHVVQDGTLEPRDDDVRALSAHALLHAAEAVVHDGAMAALDVEEAAGRAVREAAEPDGAEAERAHAAAAAARRDVSAHALHELASLVHDAFGERRLAKNHGNRAAPSGIWDTLNLVLEVLYVFGKRKQEGGQHGRTSLRLKSVPR